MENEEKKVQEQTQESKVETDSESLVNNKKVNMEKPKKHCKWKNLPRGKKISIIVSSTIWALLAVFVIIVIFSNFIFGENNPFASILGDSEHQFNIGVWFQENYM